MELTDTHCHIHEAQYDLASGGVRDKWFKGGAPNPDDMIAEAAAQGVTRLVCVGCSVEDSALAVDFVQPRPGTWASIGIHPHEAARYLADDDAMERFAALATQPKVVAVGECGLDYYYHHSSKEAQAVLLRFQIELALKHDLPLVFHVREAFEDFWPIFDEYPGVRGVIHSFSATKKELDQILQRDLYVGLNGIMTFTKDQAQLEAAKAVPLDRLLLETDAPFLTPSPARGRICQPKHVYLTAEFLSTLRGETLERIAESSTRNARALFNF
jgi:TatD DNase family protein